MRRKLLLLKLVERSNDFKQLSESIGCFVKNDIYLIVCMFSAATYGEILPEEFREVAKWMELGKDDIFMDMGSGVGRTVSRSEATQAVSNLFPALAALRNIGCGFRPLLACLTSAGEFISLAALLFLSVAFCR